MSETIKIRSAIKEDIEIIANFQLAMAKETENLELNIETLNKGVAAVFKDSTKGEYFIAEVEGSIVGSLMITYEWSDWRNLTMLWIQSVYVKPTFRGKGIFKKLYNVIHKKWQMNKELYSGIRLYVDKTNTNAMQVYNKIGMNGEHYQVFETM